MFKTNQIIRAHDKLIKIWEWLDKLDSENEPFYLAIRNGLKHIIMATLCHVLYAFNKAQCKQVSKLVKYYYCALMST